MKIAIIIILLSLVSSGCEAKDRDKNINYFKKYIPPSATNIRLLGNWWFKFELEGACYLARINSTAHNRQVSFIETTCPNRQKRRNIVQ